LKFRNLDLLIVEVGLTFKIGCTLYYLSPADKGPRFEYRPDRAGRFRPATL